jgi:hypothetical protein
MFLGLQGLCISSIRSSRYHVLINSITNLFNFMRNKKEEEEEEIMQVKKMEVRE